MGNGLNFMKNLAHNRSPQDRYWGDRLVVGECKLYEIECVSSSIVLLDDNSRKYIFSIKQYYINGEMKKVNGINFSRKH